MGTQPGCSLEGMKAEASEFLRGHIRAEDPAIGSLAKQLRQETVKLLLGPARMSALVQPDSPSIAVAGTGKERIGLQHGFELQPGSQGPVPYLDQLLQMGLDLTLMPGHQNCLDIREVLVQGGPADSSSLGDPGHRYACHAMLAHQTGRGVQNGSPDGIPMSFDGLIPELWHHRIIQHDG